MNDIVRTLVCADCGQSSRRYSPLQTRCRNCHRKKPESRVQHKQAKKRYIKRRGLSPESWQRLRKRIINRDKGCVFCGSLNALTVDHIVRVADGGSSRASNLRTLCDPCHQKLNRREDRLAALLAKIATD